MLRAWGLPSQHLHNITCECDDGYIGGRCETKTCDLKCQHGGTPYDDCTKCDGCKGAWGSSVTSGSEGIGQQTLMAKLDQISNASKKMLEGQARFNPICKTGHECVGWGIDGATGAPTRFPIVRLTYDPARTDKKFNGLSEPVEVVANHIVKPVWAGIDGGNAFPRVEDFVQHVNTQYAGASPVPKGTNGIYSSPTADVFAERFQKKDDRTLCNQSVNERHISALACGPSDENAAVRHRSPRARLCEFAPPDV